MTSVQQARSELTTALLAAGWYVLITLLLWWSRQTGFETSSFCNLRLSAGAFYPPALHFVSLYNSQIKITIFCLPYPLLYIIILYIHLYKPSYLIFWKMTIFPSQSKLRRVSTWRRPREDAQLLGTISNSKLELNFQIIYPTSTLVNGQIVIASLCILTDHRL